jgi:tetratricopeptide (TPR) repeat protein
MKFSVRPFVLACRVSAVVVSFSASAFAFGQAAAPSAASPELQEVSRLVRAGQYQGAIDKANGVLATKPKDALARFLKGVSLTELGKTNDAIAIFQSITEDNPELPEPYNNLAVLYASKGQFEKARTALELAIQTHPSYSTAHENLGDVYAKLASQAYDRALQLDKGNSGVQGKLGLIKDLFSTQPRASVKPDAAKVAAATAASPAPAAPPVPAPVVAPPMPQVAAKTEPARVAVASPAPVAAPPMPTTSAAVAVNASAPTAPPARTIPVVPASGASAVLAPLVASAPAPAAPSSAASSQESENVLNAVRNWASAWSAQDADSYLAAYSPKFQPDEGKSRREWERERRERVTAPSYVKVGVSEPAVIINGDGTAEVKFRQSYDSNRLKSHSVRKTLTLAKTKSGWQITRERNG